MDNTRGAEVARLDTAVRVEPSLVVLELSGQVAYCTVPVLRAAFERARAVPGLRPVAVLIGAVEFLHPLGVGVLALEQLAACEAGREFFVCGANASLAGMIASLWVPVRLARVADLDEARLLAGAVAP